MGHYWVDESKDGKPTGNARGFSTAQEAEAHVAALRIAVKTDPAWNGGQWAGYDWKVRCLCHQPSMANYHIHVVHMYDGQTDSTDAYVCDEHMPSIRERYCVAFGEAEPTNDVVKLRALLGVEDLGERFDILEWDVTELR